MLILPYQSIDINKAQNPKRQFVVFFFHINIYTWKYNRFDLNKTILREKNEKKQNAVAFSLPLNFHIGKSILLAHKRQNKRKTNKLTELHRK